MENAEQNLPVMPLSAASLVIASTPKHKATLTGIPYPAEYGKKVDIHHPHFLQQIRDFTDSNIYLAIEHEGLVAQIQADEQELSPESQSIIRYCREISLDVRGDIDRTTSEIFDIEQEQAIPCKSSFKRLCETLSALEQRKRILSGAKQHIIKAEEMRMNGMTQATLDAYWRTINESMRDVLKPQTAVTEYKQITRSISESINHLKRVLIFTRIAHGEYFTKPETD